MTLLGKRGKTIGQLMVNIDQASTVSKLVFLPDNSNPWNRVSKLDLMKKPSRNILLGNRSHSH